MNWHTESFGDWQARASRWHKFFAWYPVWSLSDRRTYWLQIVNRRLTDYSGYTGTCHWDYKGGL